ncbi:MAG: hypothetical protein AAGA48_15255 [Myxococcota bacterium]
MNPLPERFIHFPLAHDAHSVLVWRAPTPSQRVIRLHSCAQTLLQALAEQGQKPTHLTGVWLTRQGFEAMLRQALVDPGPSADLAKVAKAQHRLATRFAQVRVCFMPEYDASGALTGREVPCFGLRNAARHTLPEWTLRTEQVDVRLWARGEMAKAHRPSPYGVDPTLMQRWATDDCGG